MNAWSQLASASSPETINPVAAARPPDHAPAAFSMPKPLLGPAQLAAAGSADTPWLWHGYLAKGATTLLTSQWKAGKTTLASVLLARLKTGGTLAGRNLTPARAIVVSEEGPDHWLRRHAQLDFGDHIAWFCRPFQGRPTSPRWLAFIDGLAELHSRLGFSLLLIDPLAAFLPGSENHAASILAALAPLQRLTALGIAVLINHHPNKGDPPVGQAARGSGAIAGFADILIEMRAMPYADDLDRRRRLWASSRFPETPRQLVIEWTADGTDYHGLGTFFEEEFARHWQTLRALLADAPEKLTRSQILNSWPEDDRPDPKSMGTWLERAVERQLLRKDGHGRKSHPFRYWLPEREQAWRNHPLAHIIMPELFQEIGPRDGEAPA
jgi:hypothetical protein